MKLILHAALALLALPTPAMSQSTPTPSQVEKRYSDEFNVCMSSGDAAKGVTVGILDCHGAEIDKQDARLNQAYKMIMSRLNAARKSALRNSERVWIRSRDNGCRDAMGEEAGGTLGSIIYSSCILDETIKRTIWLERYR